MGGRGSGPGSSEDLQTPLAEVSESHMDPLGLVSVRLYFLLGPIKCLCKSVSFLTS